MRVGLVKVGYKTNSKEITNFTFIKEIPPESANHWMIQNYKTVGRYRNLQFAIIADTPDKKYGFASDDDTNFTKLEAYRHHDNKYYYFEKIGYYRRNGTQFAGLADAGSVHITDFTGTTGKYAGTISFYPAVFNHEQYNDLLTDLYGISQNLIANANRQVKATTIENNRSTTLLKNIENLEHSLRMINNYPFTQLTPSLTLKPENKQQKFDLRFELNRLKNPGRKYHFGSDMAESESTVENQLIKQMLEDLLQYSKNQIANLEQSSTKEDYEFLEENKSPSRFRAKEIGEELQVDLEQVEKICSQLLDTYKSAPDHSYERVRIVKIDTTDLVQYIDVDKNCLVSTNFSLTVLSEKHQRPVRVTRLVSDQIAAHLNISNLSRNQTIFATFKENGDYINIDSLHLGQILKNYQVDWLEQLTPIYSNRRQDEQKHKAFYEEKQKALLSKKTVQEREVIEKYEQMAALIEKCLEFDLFKNIENKHRLPLTPTSTFLNHPIYNMAWRALTNIDKEVELNFIYTLPYENESFSVDFVREIYERWLYFKMIDVLVNELGWSLEEDTDDLRQKIHEVFAVQKADEAVDMDIKLHFHNKMKLSVHYEPKIMMEHSDGRFNHYKPDYVLVFEDQHHSPYSLYSVKRKAVIMDSKLRHYENQRSKRNPNPELRDIAEVPLFQYDYNMLTNIKGRWSFLADRNVLMATGIFHPDLELETLFPFNVYNYFYNEEQWAETREELIEVVKQRGGKNYEIVGFETFEKIEEMGQRYSAIPFAPHHTKDFKNWFRMIMEFHLEDYETCWNCGSFNTDDELVIEKESHFTTVPHQKHYYHCTNCHEFWVKTHCGNRGANHDLIKHSYNYLQESSGHNWYIQCPHCPGVTPEKDEKEEEYDYYE